VIKNKIRTRTTDIYVDGSNIIHIKTLRNSAVDLEDAMDSFIIAKNLSHSVPGLMLADLRLTGKIDYRAIKLFIRPNVPERHKAKAVLIQSNALKILHRVFSKVNPKRPVKVFTDETEAIRWLQKHEK
jgi:hypothetical protein